MSATAALPSESTMFEAFYRRDEDFDGVFIVAVRTTGVFCRPTCGARKPKRENVRFFATALDALHEGYRPCRRCHSLECFGEPVPVWLRPLLRDIDEDPTRRWTDRDLRDRGLRPERVRRWFQQHHRMTFHAYSRARRLGAALGAMGRGHSVTRAAFDVGYDSLSGFHEAFRRFFGDAPTAAKTATVAHVDRLVTPLGPMLAAATEDALVLLEFVDRRALPNQVKRIQAKHRAAFTPGPNAVTREVARQLPQWFAGERNEFEVPILLSGTEFQCDVWDALRQIPRGQTRSYRELAEAIGRPAAVRAVGRANGENALALIVPCHRVIGSDGKLVGYGGGLWRKKRLLDLEGHRERQEELRW
ncbi:MAG: methylated-DNA--[protein]-cysteine S-methyltransferase [Myxococcota bacterium]